MAKNYFLQEHAAQQLVRHHDRLRYELKRLDAKIGLYRTRSVGTELREDSVIGLATTTVTARASSVLGEGTFEIQQAGADGLPDIVAAANRDTVTGYNVTDVEIDSGTYCRLTRDFSTGQWLVETVEAAVGGEHPVEDVAYAKAQEYWQYTGDLPSEGGADAWVLVRLCDYDGTNETGAAFDVKLPVTGNSDPNVVTGQILTVIEIKDQSDSNTTWVGVGHADDAVGTVIMMTAGPSSAASGFSVMDGTQDVTKTKTGAAIDMTGAVPKHSSTVGTSAGVATPSTTSGSTTPGASSTATGTTGSSGELTTNAATGTTGGTALTTDSSGTLTTNASSGNTGSTTPATTTSSTVASHYHSIGSHDHSIGSHTHSFSDSITVSGTTGASSGTTGASGTLTTSTHTEALIAAEEDYSMTETTAGHPWVDDDTDGSPDSLTHNHTVASHTHSMGSHTHSFSDSATASVTTGASSGTTGASSGNTGTNGAHNHTVPGANHYHTVGSHTHTIDAFTLSIGSHTHTIGSHVHTIDTHDHTIPSLAVAGVAHTHSVEHPKTITLKFYERIDNSNYA